MDCEAYKKIISSYMDGALEEKAARDLLEHLSSCSSCAAFQQDLDAMRAIFVADPAPAPSSGLRDRVVEAFREEKVKAQRRSVWRMVRPMAAAALVLAVLTVGLFIGSTDPIQAVDTDKEIHYEDLFQRLPLDGEDLLETLIKTQNPREALRIYSNKNKRRQ